MVRPDNSHTFVLGDDTDLITGLEGRFRVTHSWPVAIFPDTQHSVIAALQSDDATTRERALDLVLRVYRAPVIAVIRARWNLDVTDAEDLAHDFFLKALTNDWLARYDPARARFRTFLRQCLQAFASTAHQAAGRQKRGGHLTAVPLEDVTNIAHDDSAHDALFDQEWVRSVFAAALEAFRAECATSQRMSSFEVFSRIDVDESADGVRPTYAHVAAQLSLPVTQVTNYINWSRRRFRHHVLETLRALTVGDAEFREEARALLGTAL